MTEPDANRLSASELALRISSGKLSCEEVARSCLERIEARESSVKAWAFLDPDAVIRQSRALDGQSRRGPLHGVPIGVKDIIDTSDMPTEMGSPIYQGYRSRTDASCVALLRMAGALILGKTATCEFAGPTACSTTNPHDALRTPGGSSSGSGAAVADLMVHIALGTQTGGSVQRPSSYCGIVGYKPTFGLISTQGVRPAAESLDTVGLMARTVEDVELSARVLTNSAPVEWLPHDTPFSIGLCGTHAWDQAEDAARQAVEDAVRRLSKAGFAVRDIAWPSQFADLQHTREIINDFERARGMAHEWRTSADQLSERLAKSIRNGFTIPRETYADALQRVAAYRDQLNQVFADVDVLISPAAHGEAPLGLSSTGDHTFQSIWTQLRTPTVSLPTHAGPNGMPISVQLIGRSYEDCALLAVAQRAFAILGHGPVVNT